MIFLTLLVIPLLCAVIGFVISGVLNKQNREKGANKKSRSYSYFYSFRNLEKEITWREFVIQNVVIFVIVGIAAGIISCQNLYHLEILNGSVVNKKRVKVSCRHSYSCNCRQVCSGSGKNRSCTTVCDTCYEHSYDVDWEIYNNIGQTFDIDTEDRRGLIMPSFWSRARVGDPTATKSLYKNYIKAAPDSLFRKQGLVEKYLEVLPLYPNKIYDYYNLDRIVTVGVDFPNIDKWNKELSIVNSIIGPMKECNAIIIIVKNQPREYLYALEQYWVGANKNDAVLVISVNDNRTILWAGVLALVQESIFKVEVRDSVESVGSIKYMDDIITSFRKNIMTHYKRKEMKDFKYLSSFITPTVTQYIVTMIICIIFSVGLSIFFHEEDIL